jgi:hypothetical protein
MLHYNRSGMHECDEVKALCITKVVPSVRLRVRHRAPLSAITTEVGAAPLRAACVQLDAASATERCVVRGAIGHYGRLVLILSTGDPAPERGGAHAAGVTPIAGNTCAAQCRSIRAESATSCHSLASYSLGYRAAQWSRNARRSRRLFRSQSSGPDVHGMAST